MSGITRILYVNDYLSGGGAEVVLNQLIEMIPKEGSFQTDIFYAYKINSRMKGNPFSYVYSLRYRRELKAKLESFRPCVIHLLNYYHVLSPSVLDAVKEYKNANPGVKVIYTAHDYHLLCPNSGLTSFSMLSNEIKREHPERIRNSISLWFKKWDHRGVVISTLKALQWSVAYGISGKDKVIDGIVCPGRFMFEVMSREFPDKKISLIRNPYLPPGKISPPANRPSDGIKLVFAGRLAQEKGLLPFIKAVFPEMWRKVSLDIYGDGPQMEEIRLYISRLPEYAECTLKGPRTHGEIIGLLKNYDMLILPSLLFENAPLSMVEAAFAGLRLGVSKWGGLKAMGDFLGGSFFFDPEDRDSVNNSLNRAVSDIKNNIPVKRNYSMIRDAFDPDIFIAKHKEIYLSD